MEESTYLSDGFSYLYSKYTSRDYQVKEIPHSEQINLDQTLHFNPTKIIPMTSTSTSTFNSPFIGKLFAAHLAAFLVCIICFLPFKSYALDGNSSAERTTAYVAVEELCEDESVVENSNTLFSRHIQQLIQTTWQTHSQAVKGSNSDGTASSTAYDRSETNADGDNNESFTSIFDSGLMVDANGVLTFGIDAHTAPAHTEWTGNAARTAFMTDTDGDGVDDLDDIDDDNDGILDLEESITLFNLVPNGVPSQPNSTTWLYNSVISINGKTYDLKIEEVADRGNNSYTLNNQSSIAINNWNPRDGDYIILEYTVLDNATGLPEVLDAFRFTQGDIDGQFFGGNNNTKAQEIIGFQTSEATMT